MTVTLFLCRGPTVIGDLGWPRGSDVIIIFAIFYFMMIRPQMKRQKELRAMLAALKKGDEVTTGGGVVGKIVSLDDNFVTLEVSRVNGQSVEVVFQRNAVHSILPTGTLKL